MDAWMHGRMDKQMVYKQTLSTQKALYIFHLSGEVNIWVS